MPLWLAPWILLTIFTQLICISIAERLFSLCLGKQNRLASPTEGSFKKSIADAHGVAHVPERTTQNMRALRPPLSRTTAPWEGLQDDLPRLAFQCTMCLHLRPPDVTPNERFGAPTIMRARARGVFLGHGGFAQDW